METSCTFVHFVLILESSCSFRLKRHRLVLGVIVALAFNTVGFHGDDCQVSPVRSLKTLFGSQSLPFPVVAILLVTRQHNIRTYCWNCATTPSSFLSWLILMEALALLPLASCLVLFLILHLLPWHFDNRFLNNKHTTTTFPMLCLLLSCFMQINHGTRILLICLLEQHTILGSEYLGPSNPWCKHQHGVHRTFVQQHSQPDPNWRNRLVLMDTHLLLDQTLTLLFILLLKNKVIAHE